MVADHSRIHRLLRIVILMQQGEAGNAAGLAERFGVTERTVYRDLSILTDLGIPHYFDEQVNGYRVRKDFFLPPIHIATSEALALLVLAEGIGRTEQIAMSGPAARAVEKIRGQLPAHVLNELGDVHDHIEIHLPATGPCGEAIRDVFLLVRESIRTRRALCCQYESLSNHTDTAEFLFHPYALAFEQRSWYVMGHHTGRNEVRRLKLNRFVAIAPTDRPYRIPDDFSPSAFRGNAWRMIRGQRTYPVVITFDPKMAETVGDTNWHPTQEIEDHPDGSITFRCQVDGLDEIVWWVLGYGPHAVVREPGELADRVAELAKATAQQYFTGD